MTANLIIALVSFGVLLLFLIITFFIKPKLEASQHVTLRFLTSLCAAFGGGFLTGDTLLKIDADMPGGIKLALSGTAGFAAFFCIWFTYPKHTVPRPPDAYHISIPAGWSFSDALLAIAASVNSTFTTPNFTAAELALPLIEFELHETTALEAIRKLSNLNPGLPRYNVSLTNNTFTLQKLN